MIDILRTTEIFEGIRRKKKEKKGGVLDLAGTSIRAVLFDSTTAARVFMVMPAYRAVYWRGGKRLRCQLEKKVQRHLSHIVFLIFISS